jgi:ABC-2 type transport system ATP-binding protein
VVIHHGGILLDEPVDRLKREVLSRKTVSLTLPEGSAPLVLDDVDGATVAAGEGCRYKVSVDLKRTSIEQVLSRLIGRIRFDDMSVEDPPLEEIIQHLYVMGRAGEVSG